MTMLKHRHIVTGRSGRPDDGTMLIEKHLSNAERAIREARVTDFARYVHCVLRKEGNPARLFVGAWPQAPSAHAMKSMVEKAMVGAMSAGDLIPEELGTAFLSYAMPYSLLGRIADRVRPVPFNMQVPFSTAAITASWVGAAKPKSLKAGAFDRTSLPVAKLATMLVVSDELRRSSSDDAIDFLKAEMRNGLRTSIDTSFVDPSITAVAGVNPGSITSTATPIATTGSPESDLRALVAAYKTAGGSLASAVIFLSSETAVALALARDASGAPRFPDIRADGGILAGLPAFASDAVGPHLIMFDPSRIVVAQGGVEFTLSPAASVQMDSQPTQDGTTGAGASMVSLWQNNALGLLGEQFINWSADASAVTLIEDVDYLTEGSPA